MNVDTGSFGQCIAIRFLTASWMLAGEVSIGLSDSFHVKLRELAEKQFDTVMPSGMVLDDGNLNIIWEGSPLVTGDKIQLNGNAY